MSAYKTKRHCNLIVEALRDANRIRLQFHRSPTDELFAEMLAAEGFAAGLVKAFELYAGQASYNIKQPGKWEMQIFKDRK